MSKDKESADVIGGPAYELFALSDTGTSRASNEDCCGVCVDDAGCPMFVVADGVGGYEGGELASRMAVDTTLATYRAAKRSLGAAKRLYRAVQQANIEIYDKALVVTELRYMATTLVAGAIEDGILHLAHVGDSRVYLIRGDLMRQLTRDHTVAAERARLGLISAERARGHPDRGTLTRMLGRELIVALDKITEPLLNGDVIVACTDGLYNVLDDDDMQDAVTDQSADGACRKLIDTANARGSGDNVTAAVFRMKIAPVKRAGLRTRLQKLWGR